jgi:hypothetical protein
VEKERNSRESSLEHPAAATYKRISQKRPEKVLEMCNLAYLPSGWNYPENNSVTGPVPEL